MQNSPRQQRKLPKPRVIPKADGEHHTFTSFKPLSPENTKGAFSFSKLFQWMGSESSSPKGTPTSVSSSPFTHLHSASSTGSINTVRSKVPRSWSSPRFQRRQDSSSSSPTVQRRQLPQGYLNLTALLKRLTVVADSSKGDQLPQAYFKQYWMPDENSKECYECGEKFNTFRRRHHCRLCGQIFCYRCCNIEIPGEIMGYAGQYLRTFKRPAQGACAGFEANEDDDKERFSFLESGLPQEARLIIRHGLCEVSNKSDKIPLARNSKCGLRVCTYCNKIFQTYTQSPDMISNLEQLQADIRAVTMETEYSVPHAASMNTLSLPRSGHPFEDDDKFYSQSARKASTASANSAVFENLEQREARQTSTMQSTRSPFDAFGVCAAEANILKQGSLRDMWRNIISPRSGLELQSHRFRLKTYQNCFVASDLVDWLITHEKALTRTQAVVIGQALLQSGWLEPVPQTRYEQDFCDEYALYQPGPVSCTVANLKDQVGTPRHSLLRSGNNPEDESSADDNSEHDDDDDDKSAPQWFRQLQGYESGEDLDLQESVEVIDMYSHSCNSLLYMYLLYMIADPETSIVDAPKISRIPSVKLLDLDVTIGTAEDKDSELSLKVNLDHFGEGNERNKGQGPDNQGPTLALTTDVPPPPLEHYVYNEGYPISSLRSSNTRKNPEPVVVLGTSAEEVLKGAMMAKRIGVSRPKLTDTRNLRDDNDERQAMERICEARYIHTVHLVEQLLQDAGLSLDWKDVIMPLVDEISAKVSPDVRNDDDMDIRRYVKFKKIPGGSKSDCQVIWGVGFTKNISNKKMCSSFNNPKILVLCCAIDYQRKENRLASLDSLVLQEYEFLKNFVARVAALRPNVLLVEKTVSRLAQDMLLRYGITLALNVKPEVIERVARCTKADVLRSMEQLSRPQLGTCHHFGVQKYILKNGEAKTLMFFDGCPPELGCTVTLRGGNSLVLAKVKKIVQFLTYVTHSQKLEAAFLMDEFAMPEDPSLYFERFENSQTHLNINSKDSMTGESDDAIQEEDFGVARVFQNTLDRTVLSCSPYVQHPLPYLLTPEGSNSAIRYRLPKDIYWSARLSTKRKTTHLTEEELDEFEPPLSKRTANKGVQMLSSHPLVWSSVVINTDNQFIQGVIADFRSQGGRIQLKRSRDSNEERRKSKWLLLDMENSDERAMAADSVPVRNTLTLDKDRSSTNSKPTQVKPASPVHFNKQVDCLDPIHHQRIAVLFSSYSSESNNSPRPCISPWAVFMEFYGRNDITLGGFLERYCFRPSYVCPNPNCDIPMVDHVRYFAHGNGSVYINMKNLESPIPGFQHTILTWSWCKECKQVTPIVPLSADAWALSFAKYIELRFYADKYSRRASVEPCGHSLHRQHFQYFAFANMVASFKYRPIKLFETAIPPPSISATADVREASYCMRDVQAISNRGDTVFASILERLDDLKMDKLDYHTPERESKLHQFTTQLELTIGSQTGTLRLQEFIQAEKKRSNKATVTANQRETKSGDKVDNNVQNLTTKNTDETTEDHSMHAQYVFASPGLSPAFSPWSVGSSSPLVSNEESGSMESSDTESQTSDLDTSNRKPAYFKPINPNEGSGKTDEQDTRNGLEYNADISRNDSNAGHSASESTANVSVVSKPFVRGHRRVVSSPPRVTITACRSSSSHHNSDELRTSDGIVRSRSDSDVTAMEEKKENPSLLTSGRISLTPSEGLGSSQISDRRYKRPLSLSGSSASKYQRPENGESDSPVMSTDGTPVVRRRDKMKNIISSFLPGSTFQPIASSFPSHEHHLLPAGEKVLVVVNEKEPSSIIAYALSTEEYNHRLCEIQVTLGRIAKGTKQNTDGGQQHIKQQQQDNAYRHEGSLCVETSSLITVDDSNGDFVNVEIKNVGTDKEELDSNSAHVEIIANEQEFTAGRKKNTMEKMDKVKFCKTSQENTDINYGVDGKKLECSEQQANPENRSFSEFGFQPKDAGKDRALVFHIQMQFSYNVCRFYCNAYYAEQFKNLRKHTFEDGEERYIRSLAHCVVWRARGGKSGSTFSKSLDDRFVLKQMSRLELQSFVEFAPHYFQYMNKAITEKTFDLKGSMRSRYVQVSAGENDVLMDENLLEMIREYPIFIRPHSKAVLSKAIHNDTEFLAQHMVMDYSLLVGIDEMRSELVIGII
ncbi:hypothetical protein QZH41_011466, partial [Actinostola sp. cb2023]